MRHILSQMKEYCRNQPGRAASGAYLWLMLAVQPLAMHRGYFDVVETKQTVFLLLSAVYLGVLGAGLVLWKHARGQRREGERGLPLSGEDLWLMLFILSAVLGSLLGGGFLDSWQGVYNRYQGTGTMLVYGALWMALTQFGDFGKREWAALLAGGALVSALGIAQYMGLDPMGLRSVLEREQRGAFISTIGNIDFYGAYLSLILPGTALLTAFASTPGRTGILGALLAILEWGSLSAGGDGAAAAIAAAMALSPIFAGRSRRALGRLPLVWMGMLALLLLFRAFDGGGSGLYSSNLARLTARPWAAGLLGAGCAALYFVIARLKPGGEKRFVRGYALALCALILLCVVAVVLCNTLWREVPLGRLAQWVRWSPEWGTDRGKIWAMCLDSYQSLPWWRKLIGGGPGCVLAADARVRLFEDALVDTAHNEYLQYLLTAGALGLTGYIGLLASVLGRVLRSPFDPLTGALALGLAAYEIQALVGIAQPATTPLFFLLLSCVDARCRRSGQHPPPAAEESPEAGDFQGSGAPSGLIKAFREVE